MNNMKPSGSQPKPQPQPFLLAEVWRIRDEYAAEHHHNLKEILADLKRRQVRSRRRLVDRRRKSKPRATEQVKAEVEVKAST